MSNGPGTEHRGRWLPRGADPLLQESDANLAGLLTDLDVDEVHAAPHPNASLIAAIPGDAMASWGLELADQVSYLTPCEVEDADGHVFARLADRVHHPHAVVERVGNRAIEFGPIHGRGLTECRLTRPATSSTVPTRAAGRRIGRRRAGVPDLEAIGIRIDDRAVDFGPEVVVAAHRLGHVRAVVFLERVINAGDDVLPFDGARQLT